MATVTYKGLTLIADTDNPTIPAATLTGDGGTLIQANFVALADKALTPGPQGEQGEAGDPGPTGPAGPTGPQGPQGEAGQAGSDGSQGPQGEVGPAGPQGSVGPEGPQGDIGPQGPAGQTGGAGEAGPAGSIGPEGPQGPQGDLGPAGPEKISINFGGPDNGSGEDGDWYFDANGSGDVFQKQNGNWERLGELQWDHAGWPASDPGDGFSIWVDGSNGDILHRSTYQEI